MRRPRAKHVAVWVKTTLFEKTYRRYQTANTEEAELSLKVSNPQNSAHLSLILNADLDKDISRGSCKL